MLMIEILIHASDFEIIMSIECFPCDPLWKNRPLALEYECTVEDSILVFFLVKVRSLLCLFICCWTIVMIGIKNKKLCFS